MTISAWICKLKSGIKSAETDKKPAGIERHLNGGNWMCSVLGYPVAAVITLSLVNQISVGVMQEGYNRILKIFLREDENHRSCIFSITTFRISLETTR